MSILEKKTEFKVVNEGITVDQIVQSSPQEIAVSLVEAGAIILPSHGTQDAFFGGTLDTLDFLNENKVPTEIYSTDEDYKELALHGADIWLGTILVKYIFIPVFCGVISSYIYDKLKAQKDDNISLKFIVENKDGKTTTVSFDGKVESLPAAIDEVRKISNED
ncbi:hypothetical protein G8770_23410 [Aestuariicella hydrocarbonica]|uniref:Uncharacterized protein n=1 Tax=Pseudomaricurvus hydrocarbonicus TaxID=1470433 RepID=A0A9E5MQD0_9GAMM|nr:hypothetical protein [Aestuariicella hydrocarbonica]NHO68511.1 hypothetical protein [Aestuariicella hydrocarbonica]